LRKRGLGGARIDTGASGTRSVGTRARAELSRGSPGRNPPRSLSRRLYVLSAFGNFAVMKGTFFCAATLVITMCTAFGCASDTSSASDELPVRSPTSQDEAGAGGGAAAGASAGGGTSVGNGGTDAHAGKGGTSGAGGSSSVAGTGGDAGSGGTASDNGGAGGSNEAGSGGTNDLDTAGQGGSDDPGGAAGAEAGGAAGADNTGAGAGGTGGKAGSAGTAGSGTAGSGDSGNAGTAGSGTAGSGDVPVPTGVPFIVLGDITGATSAEQTMIVAGIALANETMATECFKNQVLSASWTETNGLSQQQIWDKLCSGPVAVDVDMYTGSWYQNHVTHTIGYEDEPGVVHMNRYYVDTAYMVADNVVHEAEGHSQGFSHYQVKATSVPYGLNGAFEACSPVDP
jgi:hypothetical protein